MVLNGDTQILKITGGQRLSGEVPISGSKNASLPIMAATILASGDFTLSNVPHLADVRIFCTVLRDIGCEASFENGRLFIETTHLENQPLNPDLIGKMRASVLVMGPLLTRFHHVVVPMPGGCSLGPRPIDFHLRGFEALGAKIVEVNGAIELQAHDGLAGGVCEFPFPSVGATENVMMAAVCAKGTTIIENAAREPEIVDLADFLNRMGAEIHGAGSSSIVIRGVHDLYPVNYRIIPDRIETASYLMAGLITGSEITCTNASPWHLPVILDKLDEAGCELVISDDRIGIKPLPRPRSVGVKTSPYPGFATDVQPMLMAAMTIADGENIFMDTIFENRFNQIPELQKLGADITVKGRVALVKGKDKIQGCEVNAPDIRASMALVIAALQAEGQTSIKNLGHLFRGYEKPVEKLRGLGAEVEIADEAKGNPSIEKKILENSTDFSQSQQSGKDDSASIIHN
jgi:UDP-N-acetylglucosamine 1-carboxyvinyltransferase